MLFNADRTALRRFFCDSWDKARTGRPLEPLEQLVAGVIARHPEYHAQLAQPDAVLEREFSALTADGNPFLHLGMHIALQEQLGSDRPPGVLDIHSRLCQCLGDAHSAEHRMMDCLGETLWEAQRADALPDETRYLHKLRRLLKDC
jgi:hypothetical protein